MTHAIHRVVGFEIVKPYTIQIRFDDGTAQVVDFRPILEGELFEPLQDVSLFNQVEIHPESHTLVWPNGADFDPETLHEWPKYEEGMREMAKRWAAKKRKVA